MGLFSKKPKYTHPIREYGAYIERNTYFKNVTYSEQGELKILSATYQDEPIELTIMASGELLTVMMRYPIVKCTGYSERKLEKIAEKAINYPHVMVVFNQVEGGFKPSLMNASNCKPLSGEELMVIVGVVMECGTRMAREFFNRGILK